MEKNMPLEIEKKFLIRMPDLEWIKQNTHCKVAKISQTYLGRAKDGYGNRIRKMTINGVTKFYYTAKKSISDMTRIELEKEITKSEYNGYLLRNTKNKTLYKTLYKTRYIIYMNNLKYEIDVYPFWHETAILEIELKDENQKYEIPGFIEIIGDVTGNIDYSNSSLARKYFNSK